MQGPSINPDNSIIKYTFDNNGNKYFGVYKVKYFFPIIGLDPKPTKNLDIPKMRIGNPLLKMLNIYINDPAKINE